MSADRRLKAARRLARSLELAEQAAEARVSGQLADLARIERRRDLLIGAQAAPDCTTERLQAALSASVARAQAERGVACATLEAQRADLRGAARSRRMADGLVERLAQAAEDRRERRRLEEIGLAFASPPASGKRRDP